MKWKVDMAWQASLGYRAVRSVYPDSGWLEESVH